MMTNNEMKVMTILGELCENKISKSVVEVIHDMLFDIDIDEPDEEYIAEFAKKIDEIIVNS